MVTKKIILKSILVLAVFLAVSLVVVYNLTKITSASSCPSNTVAEETQATLVGEITDTGGDPNLEVWFQYGRTSSYGLESAHMSMNGIGLFCTTVTGLDPCTTYHYRAVAKNSAGTSYGSDKTFTTICGPTVDIKANNSNGPISILYGGNISLSWTSHNATSCQASGDWSGSKLTSGSETIHPDIAKTYNFTIACQNTNGTQTTDSVQVNVLPKPPTVITKPAIVTY